MRRVEIQESWPESWKYSHPYDELEVWGSLRHRGYAYAYAERRRHTLELVARAAPPPARVLDIAAAGLGVCELRLFNNPLTGGCLRTEPLLKVLPRSVVLAGEALSRNLPAALRDRLATGMAALLRRPADAAGKPR